MGLFSWLFPSEQDHLARARRFLEKGDFNNARLEVAGIETEEARRIVQEAEGRLVRLNLERAQLDINAGSLDEAQARIEVATEFARGLFVEELKDARRTLREARTAARTRSRGPAISADPFGQREMGLVVEGAPVPMEAPSPGFKGDPIFSLPPDDPRVRYALLMESYPEAIRSRSMALGAPYAEVVLALDEGDAAGAVARLGPFVERDVVARYERARAHMELGRAAAVVEDLEAFVKEFSHQRMGQLHTAILLARALVATGRAEDALSQVRQARAQEPKALDLMGMEVSLLEEMGRLPEAESLARSLLIRAPKDMGVIKMMARIRLKAGKRMEAMQVLESGLSATTCAPGKCGHQPPDVDALRMLARLYLEDRLDPPRADELLDLIASSAPQPDWMDGYLVALRARNRNEPDLERMTAALLEGLGPADPRVRLVRERLGEGRGA